MSGPPTLVITGHDPLNALAPDLVHPLLRLLIMILTWYASWTIIYTYFVMSMFVITTILLQIRKLSQALELLSSRKSFPISRKPHIIFTSLQAPVSFYKMLLVYDAIFNDACKVSSVGILFSGGGANVISNYGIVRLGPVLNFGECLVFVFTALFSLIAIAYGFPLASAICEQSSGLIGEMKKKIGSGYDKKLVDSLRAMRISVGPFFSARRSSKARYLYTLLEVSVNLILCL